MLYVCMYIHTPALIEWLEQATQEMAGWQVSIRSALWMPNWTAKARLRIGICEIAASEASIASTASRGSRPLRNRSKRGLKAVVIRDRGSIWRCFWRCRYGAPSVTLSAIAQGCGSRAGGAMAIGRRPLSTHPSASFPRDLGPIPADVPLYRPCLGIPRTAASVSSFDPILASQKGPPASYFMER